MSKYRCKICDREVLMPNGFCPTCKKMTKTYELDHHIFLNESHWEHESEDDACDFHHPEQANYSPSVRVSSFDDAYKNPLSDTSTIKPNEPRIGNAPTAAGPVSMLSENKNPNQANNKPAPTGNIQFKKAVVIIVVTILALYALICCVGIFN